MAKINGIDVSSIVKFMGKETSSITNIMGIQTSSIPGWPSAIKCELQILKFVPLTMDQNDSCSAEPMIFNYSSEKILYNEGYCGNDSQIAPDGYYSSIRGDIFKCLSGVLDFVGSCSTYATFINLTNEVVETSTNQWDTSLYQYSTSQSTVSALYGFEYQISGFNTPGIELYVKQSPTLEYPYDGSTDTTAPKYLTPPFSFINSLEFNFKSFISVSAGNFISVGFVSHNLPPNTSITVTVKVNDGGSWTQINTFTCTNNLVTP